MEKLIKYLKSKRAPYEVSLKHGSNDRLIYMKVEDFNRYLMSSKIIRSYHWEYACDYEYVRIWGDDVEIRYSREGED